MKIKLLAISASLCLASSNLTAQRTQGTAHSNFTGIRAAFYNPAKLANTRSKISLNLFQFGVTANNNVMDISKDSLKNGGFGYSSLDTTQTATIDLPVVDIALPSVSLKLNKKLTVGLTTRLRGMFQVNNLSSFYTKAFIADDIVSQTINDGTGFSTNLHSFTDIGATAGLNLINNNKIMFNIGASLKLYSGLGFAGVTNKGFKGQTIEPTIASPAAYIKVDNIDLDAKASSTNLDNIVENLANPSNFFNSSAGKGLGGDIGAELIIKKEEKSNYNTAYQPYKLKLGAALLDIGKINYSNVTNVFIKGGGGAMLNIDSLSEYSNNISKLATYCKRRGLTADSVNISHTTSLPTTAQLYADFSLTKKIFIAAALQLSLADVNGTNPYYRNQFTIAPRYESKLFDVALPFTYNMMSKDLKMGAALRFAFVTIGSDDLGLVFKDSKGGNVYAGLSFNIFKGKK